MAAYDTTLQDTIHPPGEERHAYAAAELAAAREALLPKTSLAALAAVASLAAIFLATSFYRLNHTDLWGHLALGRWIAQHGELPAADPLRTFAGNEHFVNVPWLSQLAGYGWHETAGPDGLLLAQTVLVTLTAAILMLAAARRGVPAPWAVAAGVAGYLLALPIVGTIRPQLFGMAGFALVLLAVAQLRRSSRPLWWLPVLFMAWANLHGSFATGLVALGCWAAGMSWQSRLRGGSLRAALKRRTVRRAWAALLLATAGSCVNPLGPALLIEVGGFAGGANLAAIREWQPLAINSLGGCLFSASVLISAVLLRTSPRKVRPFEVLMILVFALAALTAMRMLVWWALLWPWIAAPHAAAAWRARRRSSWAIRRPRPDEPTTMRTLIAMAVVFMALLIAPASHGFIAGQTRGEGQVASPGTPLYLADEIERRGITGRIFAPMDWGDYLAWHGRGSIEPLVHSHVHLIPPGVWNDYRQLAGGLPRWLDVVDRYDLRYLAVRLEAGHGLKNVVFRHPRCRVLYRDQQALLVEVLPPKDEPATAAVTTQRAFQKVNMPAAAGGGVFRHPNIPAAAHRPANENLDDVTAVQ